MSASVLGLIPVREGSKRLPGKNVADLGGKPLLAHTIEQANAASELDRVVVSTESDAFRRIACDHGGEAPFARPDELATDDATNKDVVEHALGWFERTKDTTFDIVCMLQVTSPFRTAADIDGALKTLRETDATSVVSTAPFDTPPFWAVEKKTEYLRPYFGEDYLWSKTQSQTVPDLRHPNGAVFAVQVEAFHKERNFYTDRTAEYKMPRKRSLDIDEPFDLELARALYTWRNNL